MASSEYTAVPNRTSCEVRRQISIMSMITTGPDQQTPQMQTHHPQLTNGNARSPVAASWRAINTVDADQNAAHDERTGSTGAPNLYAPKNWSVVPPIDKPRKQRDSDSSNDKENSQLETNPAKGPSKKQKTVKKRNGTTKRPEPNETGQGRNPVELFVNHVGSWLKDMKPEDLDTILDESDGGGEEDHIALASAPTELLAKHEMLERLVGPLADSCIPRGSANWEKVFQPYKDCACKNDSSSSSDAGCPCDWRAGWQNTKRAGFENRPENLWANKEDMEGLTAAEVSLAEEAFLPWARYREVRARIFLGFACLVEQNVRASENPEAPPDHPFRMPNGEFKMINLGPSQAQTVCKSIDVNPVSFVAKAYSYKGWLPQSSFKKNQDLWEIKLPEAQRARIYAVFQEWEAKNINGRRFSFESSSSEHSNPVHVDDEEDEDVDDQEEQ